jgi:toxin ParE1/3/4
MNLTLIFRSEAVAETQEAFAWYEAQRRGMGVEFRDELQETLDKIQANPNQYPVVHRNVRRALVRRFPYGVFYVVEGQRIVVLAVFHGSRDPGQWKSRT